MEDLGRQRDYLSKRRMEACDLRDSAAAVVREIDDVLDRLGPHGDLPPLRFAEWTEARRAKLDAWAADRYAQIEHIEVELFVLAFAPAPPVWLVYWIEPEPWWRATPWRTLAALWGRVRARVRGSG